MILFYFSLLLIISYSLLIQFYFSYFKYSIFTSLSSSLLSILFDLISRKIYLLDNYLSLFIKIYEKNLLKITWMSQIVKATIKFLTFQYFMNFLITNDVKGSLYIIFRCHRPRLNLSILHYVPLSLLCSCAGIVWGLIWSNRVEITTNTKKLHFRQSEVW